MLIHYQIEQGLYNRENYSVVSHYFWPEISSSDVHSFRLGTSNTRKYSMPVFGFNLIWWVWSFKVWKKNRYSNFYFQFSGVCFLIICHHNFSKKLAFNYLAELAQSFLERYATQIGQASRPYTFIEFGKEIRFPIQLNPLSFINWGSALEPTKISLLEPWNLHLFQKLR